ncbi:SH3 domain-containing protein [Ruegeria sp. A3M17]|uniref:SH3 domain-containing protein n=1 Tax=Ruegeria sp. A3M17 TaxID=2267229 RepID=UPI000DE9FF50|nr:SH3 domain-containing protein [Ruegeria sp. A3M17]RBW57763.1 SH3 domain-containing protein [Ruegeria sp. A3M17]
MIRAFLMSLLFCGPALADRQSFPPVDEAERDPTLVAFRDSLLASVAARDTEAVIATACPDIYLSHGGNGGPGEFLEYLAPENSGSQENQSRDIYWGDLESTLSQPGYFDDEGEFWMPHQWQITLPASLDPYEAYFVTGEDVTLRQAAEPGSPALSLISYEVVIVPTYRDGTDYQPVMLTDGTRGFMHGDFLWPMTGHRAAFVKSGAGEWQLCTFVSGD